MASNVHPFNLSNVYKYSNRRDEDEDEDKEGEGEKKEERMKQPRQNDDKIMFTTLFNKTPNTHLIKYDDL